MWETLNNLNTVLAIIVSCITIVGAAITLNRRKNAVKAKIVQIQSTSAQSPSSSPPRILRELDFWEKATVIGQGIMEGLFYGFMTFGITAVIVFVILIAILFLSSIFNLAHLTREQALQLFFTDMIISGIVGIIVGSMVGIVSGVNETKDRADAKRAENDRKRSFSSLSTSWGQKKVETKIPSAPLLKDTGNPGIDWAYKGFCKQIEDRMNSSMTWGGTVGALILFAEADLYGEVVNLVDHRSWKISSGESEHLLSTKQTYIKTHQVNHHSLYAAVFSGLQADQGYVVWSDKRPPALAIVSSKEATTIDWRSA